MSKELYIVFIINHRYVRWETFPLNSWMIDVFSLLKDKYYIEQCILEIDELFISKNMNYHLLEFCKSGGATIYISTKDPNYTLSKNIY
jgi:hypothetical protein